jgi:hypothetical protein
VEEGARVREALVVWEAYVVLQGLWVRLDRVGMV